MRSLARVEIHAKFFLYVDKIGPKATTTTKWSTYKPVPIIIATTNIATTKEVVAVFLVELGKNPSETMRMENKRMKPRRTGLCALSVTALTFLSWATGCMAKLEPLRRQDPRHYTAQEEQVGADENTDRKKALASLWENEARLAQTEAERVLFGWNDAYFSFPTPKPTPAPVPATPRPTGPGGTTPQPAPTPSPGGTSAPTPVSCLVGTTRDAFLLQQLSQITSATLLTNPSTPQGSAYTFMINDPLQPDVCTYPTLQQRFALATFYYSTSGTSWVDDTGWLSATEECTWNGVTCEGGTAVTKIDLGK